MRSLLNSAWSRLKNIATSMVELATSRVILISQLAARGHQKRTNRSKRQGNKCCRRSDHAAATSFAAPRATIFIASSDNGRCSASALCRGARIQTSHSSSVVRMTGIAWPNLWGASPFLASNAVGIAPVGKARCNCPP